MGGSSHKSASGHYGLVILDFDGVLADSAPWMVDNLDAICRAHGLASLAPETIVHLRGQSNREIVRAMGIPFWKLPAIARDMRRRVAMDAHRIPLFPHASGFIQALHQAGVRLAIASSNAEANVRAILGEETAALIDAYACGAGLFGKARLFRKLQRASGLKPSAILCVGDETRDIEAARSAGLACAAVTWGYANPEALARAKPDYLADSFEALQAIIAG